MSYQLDTTVVDAVAVPARSPLRKSPVIKSMAQFGNSPTPLLTPKVKKNASLSPILIPQLDYAYHSFSDDDDASCSEESIFSADPQSPTRPHTKNCSVKIPLSLAGLGQFTLMEILNEEVDARSYYDSEEDLDADELDLLDVMSTCVITDVTERVSFSMGAVMAEVNTTH